jgi:hypothetical protein
MVNNMVNMINVIYYSLIKNRYDDKDISIHWIDFVFRGTSERRKPNGCLTMKRSTGGCPGESVPSSNSVVNGLGNQFLESHVQPKLFS